MQKIKTLIQLIFLLFYTSAYASEDFIYLERDKLEAVTSEIDNFHFFFYNAYLDLIDAADDEISKAVNPVTNKSLLPPSGDKQDYYSIGPYWWPDPSKEDGLPWIYKDGQVNPDTKGDNVDWQRSAALFPSVRALSLAYYFSGNERYAKKAYEHINAWFLDEETLMNPNLKYSQGVPGGPDGRPAGIIAFAGVGDVITAIQILEEGGFFSADELTKLKQWMSDMVNWLTTHENGIAENNSTNNHGTWYDYQVLGMYMFVGDTAKAVTKAESIKTRRIAAHIKTDGSQPEELKRTKSVNYSNMNLWAMTRLSLMAKKLGVDLWNYESSDGRSIRRAYEFLSPYAMQPDTWTWQQISGGGASASIESLIVPLFAKASSIFNETLLPTSKSGSYSLSFDEKLCFPPLDMLKEENNKSLSIRFSQPSKDTSIMATLAPDTYAFDVDLSSGNINDLSLWMCVDGVALKTGSNKRQVWTGNQQITHSALSDLTQGEHELKVVAQLADGRINENYITVTITPPTGASLQGTSAAELKLYPNPTTGLVFLSQECHWQVFSMVGEMLQEAYGTTINLYAYKAGIYLVKSPFGNTKVILH